MNRLSIQKQTADHEEAKMRELKTKIRFGGDVGALAVEDRDLPDEIVQALLACARGVFQRDLLAGQERWSLSTLGGEAKKYAGRYARSRDALLGRINDTVGDVEAVYYLNESSRWELGYLLRVDGTRYLI